MPIWAHLLWHCSYLSHLDSGCCSHFLKHCPCCHLGWNWHLFSHCSICFSFGNLLGLIGLELISSSSSHSLPICFDELVSSSSLISSGFIIALSDLNPNSVAHLVWQGSCWRKPRSVHLLWQLLNLSNLLCFGEKLWSCSHLHLHCLCLSMGSNWHCLSQSNSSCCCCSKSLAQRPMQESVTSGVGRRIWHCSKHSSSFSSGL